MGSECNIERILEGPLYAPMRKSGLGQPCAMMYGPAVRRKMMLAD